MTDFPSLEQFEKTTGESGDYILGGSIGINKILLKIRDLAEDKTAKPFDIYLFSLYTLARNNFRPGMTVKEMAAGIETDMSLLSTYVEAFHSNVRGSKKPTIVFYVPTYRIPQTLLKEHAGRAVERENLFRGFAKTITHDITEVDTESNRNLVRCGHKTYPHKELLADILSGKFGNNVFGYPTVCLLSHCLIDMHMVNHSIDLTLIESYTGRLRKYKEFGERIIPEPRIPFNLYTHRLFGDDMLKPLLPRNEKKKALELAETHKWYLKTESELLQEITLNLSVKADDLKLLKF